MKKVSKKKKKHNKVKMYPGVPSWNFFDSECLLGGLDLSMEYAPLRNVKILELPIAHLLSIAAGKARVLLPPSIPEDSYPFRIFEENETNQLCMVLTHPSFDEVAIGCTVPRYKAIVTFDPVPVITPLTESHDMEAEEDSIERQV